MALRKRRDEDEVTTGEVELEEDEGFVDPDDDDGPKPKVKAKAVKTAEEEEDQDLDEQEEISKPKLVKKRVRDEEDSPKKVASKKGGKEDMSTEKKHRGTAKGKAKTAKSKEPRQSVLDKHGIPYSPDSLIGQVFQKAEEGASISNLKKFIQANKGGLWILSRIKRGKVRDGSVTWKATVKDGFLKLSSVKRSA